MKIPCRHELVVCLSEKIRDAVLDEQEHEISAQCRKQLRIEKEVEVNNNILLGTIILGKQLSFDLYHGWERGCAQ